MDDFIYVTRKVYSRTTKATWATAIGLLVLAIVALVRLWGVL
jgi:cytochrome b